MVLMTLKVMVQLLMAGIMAFASVTLLVVLVNDIAAPVQVVAGAGIAWIARFAGKTCVRPDWVKSKPLLLVNVMVSAEAAFGATVAGAKASVTTGAIGVMVIRAGQALAAVFAEAGAVVLAPGEVKVTVAVSVFPVESVTVRVKFPRPVAVTLTCAEFMLDTICTAPTGVDQAYEV